MIDRERTSLLVVNSGDRPVQVGSHYHFAAANPALLFDRDAARGRRLAVPAGTAVRFEPGVEKTVELVELGGTKTVPGLRLPEADVVTGPWSIDRARYAELYGPTVGDRIRLADTDLLDRGHRGPLPRARRAATRSSSAAARSSASRWARPAPPAARAPRTW